MKDLRRELGFWDAVVTGIAAMIGAGIFVVSGIATRVAGSAVILAFIIAGVVALFNALSSAELAAAIPREGGTYEYARRLLSRKVGFLTGWLFVSSKMLESATVALAFGAYASLFLYVDPRILAVIVVIALTVINAAGIRASTNANWIMALIKIGVLIIFVLFGVGAVKSTNFDSFVPINFQGVLAASAIIFFAYTGYARIATLGEEIKNPEKTIPKAILASLFITAIVYVAVTTVAIGLVGVENFASSDSPIATAASVLGNAAFDSMIVFGAAVATLSVLLSDLLSSSRTAFAMARNGELPKFLSHLRDLNPVNSIVATALIVLALVLTGSLVQIAALTSLTILIYYAVTNVSALKLPAKKRLFPRLISVMGLVSCLALTVFLSQEQWLWTVLLLLPGIVYMLIRRI
jgi:APA family basic amino acid/polyamine antiporter